jgi:hypothetical protein
MLNLNRRLPVKQRVERLLRRGVDCGADFARVCLKLGQATSEMVQTSLVDDLKTLKDKGRLRVPLPLGIFHRRGRRSDFIDIGPTASVLELIGPLVRIVHVPYNLLHRVHAPRHGLQFLSRGIELAQRALDIGFYVLRKSLVGLG